QRAADQRVPAEALVERPQVVVQREREAHPVHRLPGRSSVGGVGLDDHPLALGLAHPDDHRPAVDVQQAPQPAVAAAQQPVAAARHEGAELLGFAREADILPYFRILESAAAPVVEMEGAERIMLGSNNYLGLTADPRVIQGAHEAIDRYGTGLTGSRFLNGTI